jgi:predicted GNAT family acetyltransferase
MGSTIDPVAEIESEDYMGNVIWVALSGAQAPLAQSNEDGLRYKPEFAPFGAARNYSESSVAQIAQMLQANERLTLFTQHKPAIPPGYDIVREATVIQMMGAREFAASDEAAIVELGKNDVPDMLELVEKTDPGPFKERTPEMGRFVGVRERGQLVAMAGERMVAGKYVELSAVCTHPDWRGRGLAGRLMEHLGAGIQHRGQVPFLHVFSTNTSAIRLYKQLGFRSARTLHLTGIVVRAGLL